MNSKELRKNIYKALDQVIETGVSVPIEQNGRRLRIILDEPIDKLKNLKKRDGLRVDPDDLLNLKWEIQWKSPL